MQRVLHALITLAVAGCSDDHPAPDIVGPFTGELQRYAVSDFELPATQLRARELADDFEGDRGVDNAAGKAIAVLVGLFGNLTTAAPDMIAAGVITSYFEIRADDFAGDDSIGIRYVGGVGEPAIEMGAAAIDHQIVSNRIATSDHLGSTILHLPVFRDADPLVLPMTHIEVELTPSRDGFEAVVHGCVTDREARDAATVAVTQMVTADPESHREAFANFDTNTNGVLERHELDRAFDSYLYEDVTLRDGSTCLSLGFVAHLTTCASGSCSGPVVDHCADRVVDGDESDVDCGGSTGCLRCAVRARCTADRDCQTGSCQAGRCHVPEVAQ